MSPRLFLFSLLVIPLLTSCDLRSVGEKFVAEAESEFAKAHFDLYRTGDVDRILAELNPEIIDDEIQGKIEEVVEYVPESEPIGVEVVGSQTFLSGDTRTVNITLQYQYPDQWLVFFVSVDAASLPFKVNSVNAQLLEQSLAELNAFRLTRNGVKGILFVFFGVAVPIFCLAVFVICLRTPMAKGKWRWAIFTLLGVMTYRINWTTGQWDFNPMHIQIFGAGVSRSGFYGPWILSVAIPFGALVFLAKRNKLMAKALPDETSPDDGHD